jgi:hypothetical protein
MRFAPARHNTACTTPLAGIHCGDARRIGPGSVGLVRRGFVESLTCTAADWLAHADAIRSRHPVRCVQLTDRPVFRMEWLPERDRFDPESGARDMRLSVLVRWGDRIPQKFQWFTRYTGDIPRNELLTDAREQLYRSIDALTWMGEPGSWWPGIAFAPPG